MLLKEWREFIVYPGDSSRVKSIEQRLNTATAFRVGADGSYPPEMNEVPNSERACVIPLSLVVQDGDTFECMEINEQGHVCVWTREKVWFLTREGNDSKVEKLRYVPRHPPMTAGYNS